MSDEWDDVSYVISSKYRVDTLDRLQTGPATPSLVAADTDRAIAHISRALQELQEEGLVTLLVSEERRKGRVYGVTEKGADVIEKIHAQDMV
ncbi:winged helix-turn-helix domain-containing protein [Haloarcula salinisoli]|uniref:Winged helix-turn-helix domain-containing protein n=1 Tax=Haloarcula salinisoli TaxID=2487746 RepID=A0A8J8CB93_9EURY|nr:winged helix-turn-helix domain-containing protein [Halomicroarcula salinisoli]MBX0288309.1 winged helix-turn-helix domain-containing protein [Halomicroarcula salinisoli]MBX0305969.1 winged helix-turn-helix domain-containing protein [Halomicroarcula salinisoli]